MVMWVFGYGSLIWNAGFQYDQKLAGFIKGYRRVFYQVGSTDHRGTPAFPGRTVTLELAPDDLCYLEVREKQYDQKVYVDLFTDSSSPTPAVSGVMVYVASPDTKANTNYLGPAPIEDIAKQIIKAEGPSGRNRDYLFQLEEALNRLGCFDMHVRDLANAVRELLKDIKAESDIY
ncbi:gamma-glutamylcyclotransferase 2-3-like isoform X3 [Phalaenopsis equestris]|uniref:gamma-glutamylcyclotransferase 2-3-like isoform X3 n=1 Tax=Phalaenopsis equestris TaxID=78828 RepID=UPI0009E2E90C|nr:gamma-glutamylcyclotransferase 2-3-like isoform X3 [Phalaenopsis equestris]